MSFIDFNKFNSNQVILSSDRLVLNAKNDGVYVMANKTIGFSTGGSFHINVGTKGNNTKDNVFILNSPRIELGLSSKGDIQPIAKGQSTEDVLNQILTALSSFSSTLGGSVGVGVGVVDLPMIIAAAQKLGLDISNIQKNVRKIKSEVTFSL